MQGAALSGGATGSGAANLGGDVGAYASGGASAGVGDSGDQLLDLHKDSIESFQTDWD